MKFNAAKFFVVWGFFFFWYILLFPGTYVDLGSAMFWATVFSLATLAIGEGFKWSRKQKSFAAHVLNFSGVVAIVWLLLYIALGYVFPSPLALITVSLVIYGLSALVV